MTVKIYSKFDAWRKYLEYLKQWIDDHSEVKFAGCSPASFNEWLANEGSKRDEYS